MELEIFLFSAAVSLDLAAAAFALGSTGIKLPHLSAAILSAAGALFLVIPAAAGGFISGFSAELCSILGKGLLCLLGGAMLLKHFLKASHRSGKGEKYPLCVCLDESKADCADTNRDCRLSAAEAIVLGAGLSADSAVTGFSAGLSGISPRTYVYLFLTAFIVGFISAEVFSALGKKISGKLRISTDIAGGVILIILALLF